jgi:hypothetical protein
LLTLKNTTNEHTDGGAESKIVFKDHADNSLGKIEVSHNGTNDNALGNMYFQTSNGSTVVTALELNSSQNATFTGNVSVVDNKYFAAGTGGDLIIRHLSSDNSSYIQSYTGDFYFDNRATTKSMFFRVSNSSAGDTTAVTIKSNGDVGIGTSTPYAYDTTATKFHVKNAGSSGSLSEIARFEGSSDADGSGGTIRLGTSNDRGIYFEGGRTGSVPYGKIGTTEYDGSKTLAITLDNSGNATFAGIVETDKIFVAKGQNLSHTTSSIKISQESTTKSQIRFYGADTSTAGSLEFVGSSSNGSAGGVRLTINANGSSTFSGTISSGAITSTSNIEAQDTFILNYNNAGNKWQQLFDGSNGWNLRYYNDTTEAWSSNYINVNTSGNATFAGNVTLNTGTNKILSVLASTHNASVAAVATLALGYTHSGGDAFGRINLVENATNSFDANMHFSVPHNNGSGGSTSRTALTRNFCRTCDCRPWYYRFSI